MELHGKEGITKDFLSLRKESPLQNSEPNPSPGQHGRAARIDLNVVADQSLARAAVKPEWAVRSSFRSGSHGPGGVFRPWTETDNGRRGAHQQWPSTPSSLAAGHSSSSSSGVFPSPCKRGSSRETRESMEDDEEEFLRENPSLKGLSVKVDGRNDSPDRMNDERKPSTPRSKHSATEQRRRSKINDRFQALRTLIPHTDQKKDKASFLLEVIEYIQLLKEKVQKYESPYPVRNPDNTKLIPWKNIQAHTDGMAAAPASPALLKNTPLTNNLVSPIDSIGAASSALASTASLHANLAGPRGFGVLQPQPLSVLPPSVDLCDDADRLVIDDASISLSSAYSQGLLGALTQALEGLGIDLSQASISVKINLGRQAPNQATPSLSEDVQKGSADDDSVHLRRPAKRRSTSNG